MTKKSSSAKSWHDIPDKSFGVIADHTPTHYPPQKKFSKLSKHPQVAIEINTWLKLKEDSSLLEK
jgi:hypothetical protein